MKKALLVLFVLLLASITLADVPRTSGVADGRNSLNTVSVQGSLEFDQPQPFALKPITGLEESGIPIYTNWMQTDLHLKGDWYIDEGNPTSTSFNPLDLSFDVTTTLFGTVNPVHSQATIRVVNSLYSIKFEEGIGDTAVFITVTKDGAPCGGSNGRISKTLTRGGIWITEFQQQCGIAFFAEWETIAYRADVEVHYISFSDSVLVQEEKKVMDYIETNVAKQEIKVETTPGKFQKINTHFVSAAEQWRDKFRVINIDDPLDFVRNEDNSYAISVHTPIFFNEEISQDPSGKTKGLVITKGSEILYFITIIPQISNEYWVAKSVSTPKPKIQDYLKGDYSDLENEVFLDSTKWKGIQGVKENDHDDIIQGGLVATSIVGAGTSVATLGAFGTTIGVAALTLTPAGWIVGAGVAVVALAALPVYHFTDTDTYFYDGTPAKLVINDDLEFWSKKEAKVNFLLVGNPNGTKFEPTAIIKDGWIGIAFETIPAGVTIDEISQKMIFKNAAGTQLDVNTKYVRKGVKFDVAGKIIPASDTTPTVSVTKDVIFIRPEELKIKVGESFSVDLGIKGVSGTNGKVYNGQFKIHTRKSVLEQSDLDELP